jgi:hypothetical protein
MSTGAGAALRQAVLWSRHCKLVGCQLDLLVSPLGCPVEAGDKPHAVQPPKIAVDERVAGLCLIWSAFSKAEMPGGILVPRVSLRTRSGPARAAARPASATGVRTGER